MSSSTHKCVSDPLPASPALPLCKGENANVPVAKGDGREASGVRLRAVFYLLLLLASCARPQPRTTVRVAVGGQTQLIYLPLTLADRLGYFKDEGLSVQISDLRG